MFVDWVLISYMDQSELLLKRSGKFNDNIVIGIEINEKIILSKLQ